MLENSTSVIAELMLTPERLAWSAILLIVTQGCFESSVGGLGVEPGRQIIGKELGKRSYRSDAPVDRGCFLGLGSRMKASASTISILAYLTN